LHIPDGYLSPLFSLATGAATVPAWTIASRRVNAVLSHRMIPLLSVFGAFSFTIMMFNIPVPGGTTAHGVGGTLAAIVLGPAGAVIAVSIALVIQALFFGDGGVLAIFANSLNMGVLLPLVGYGSYRLLAGRSPILSSRRVWAAGIGAYVGITAAALAVGIELGVQPLLFSENGQPLYSPYGLTQAVPAMLLAHVFGASIVEALVTAFGVAYLQKRHPEYLVSLRTVFAGPDVAEGVATGRPLWQLAAAIAGGGTLILAIAGLVTGGGDLSRAFGADWTRVDWASVATMLLAVAALALVLVPLAWLLAPRRIRGIVAGFVAAALLAPLGLIAPGFAYGEGSAEDVRAAFGYVPKGLQQLSGAFGAPLSGYNLPLPFFSDANAALWQTALGYELAGMLGILLLGAVLYGIGRLLLRAGGPSAPADRTPSR